jgi:hypothetical protein
MHRNYQKTPSAVVSGIRACHGEALVLAVVSFWLSLLPAQVSCSHRRPNLQSRTMFLAIRRVSGVEARTTTAAILTTCLCCCCFRTGDHPRRSTEGWSASVAPRDAGPAYLSAAGF